MRPPSHAQASNLALHVRAPLVLALTAALAACGGEDEGPPDAVRPVTILELEDASPVLEGRLTGLAEPYRSEEVGFEVGGRLTGVENVGREVTGPTFDAAGALLESGALLAQLDTTRYEQALRSAELARDSNMMDVAAQQVEVDTVAQSELQEAQARESVSAEEIKSAEANETLARAQLDRQAQLLDDGVVSQAAYDRAKRDHDSAAAALEAARSTLVGAQAAVTTAQDSIQLKEAQIESTKAVVAEYENAVEQARTDLEDCTLTAPFPGRITERHYGIGGFVSPGGAVVTLTMMDPVKVVVMTTAEKSRRLLPGSSVTVYPKDLASFTDAEALYGVVFDKAEVADPATRTFKVEVLLRNLRRPPVVQAADGAAVPTIDRMFPVITREGQEETGPYFVHPSCVLTQDGQTYVYRIPGLYLGRASQADMAGVFHPEAVLIQLLDEYVTLRFSFQRVADGAGLREGEILIVNPRPEQLEGAARSGYDWAIRPGDIVPVQFDVGDASRGFYVPTETIATLNGATSVFAIGDDGRAKRIPVTVHETVGLRRRIESDQLRPGMRIVVDGAHYVADGDRTRVVEKLGL